MAAGEPTKDMLEQQRRLSRGIPGIPQTEVKFVTEHLNNIRKQFDENTKKLGKTPKWVGELYLELHRGTYTSIAKNKRNNRKCEIICREAETVSVIENLLLNTDYPSETLHECWHFVLLHQFHDILPGSSIKEVYDECDKAYEKILSFGSEIVNKKIKDIISDIKTDGGLFVYNPNPFSVSAPVKSDGKMLYVENIPALGYKIVNGKREAKSIKIGNKTIENEFYVIKFNDSGSISSIYDKTNCRQVILKGCSANEFQVFEDFPKGFDAWEISDYYKEKMWVIDNAVSFEPINDGVRGGFEITWKFLRSEIKQQIFVYDDVLVIDFDTVVDWRESHLLLKTSFPIDVHTSEAAYDVQFGYVKRPTHENTSWDAAKFEVCAHKWADISDGDYGGSLMNDCKYGYSAEGSTLKLSLIKCATYPNPEADKETHRFTYSLYPHYGDFKQAEKLKMSLILNQPLYAYEIGASDGKLEDTYSLISCVENNIVIETVKKAEQNDDIIVRYYEANDKRTLAHIVPGFGFTEVYLCDMLENNIEKLHVKNGEVCVSTRNFEIITLRFIK